MHIQWSNFINVDTGIPRLVRFFGPQATALIEHWFSTKIAILDFWIFKVPFLLILLSYLLQILTSW